MTDDAARARSFGSVADGYERYRPGYPLDAVRWLLAAAPGARVVDLGAGTGKLSAVLVAAGASVIAVEPDPAMRAQLVVAVPAADSRAGSAEAIPLGDGAADAVLAAQAFHWFDHQRALPELARVLVPGGVLGILWNLRNEDEPWVAALSAELAFDISDGTHSVRDPEVGGMGVLARSPLFGPIEAAQFPYAQELTEDALVALIRTRSLVTLMAAAARDDLLARIRRLCREHPDLAGRAKFTMPYVTHVFRAHLRA